MINCFSSILSLSLSLSGSVKKYNKNYDKIYRVLNFSSELNKLSDNASKFDKLMIRQPTNWIRSYRRCIDEISVYAGINVSLVMSVTEMCWYLKSFH